MSSRRAYPAGTRAPHRRRHRYSGAQTFRATPGEIVFKGADQRQAERAARRAEVTAMFVKEREEAARREQAAVVARRAEQVLRHGYGPGSGGIGDGVEYGVAVHADGTITVGDPELGAVATGPLRGATATLETFSTLAQRPTASWSAALGSYALALPKWDKRIFLAVTGPGIEAAIPVDPADPDRLRSWVAWFNTHASSGDDVHDRRPGEPDPRDATP